MCQAVEKQRRDSMVTAHENLTPQTVVWRPAAAASLTSLLEIQNFSYRLRHTESEFAYERDPQMICMHVNIWKVQH